MSARTLVVAATRAEAAHVPDGYEVLITGIGKTPAATALTRRLCAYEAGADGLDGLIVVNIGTAGALHDHHDGLYDVGVVINHDINADALRRLNYDPRERLTVGESGTVLASGDVFVTDPVIRERLAATADLVDMEGYALAYVAEEFGVPLRMIKHVSDHADDSAWSWVEMVDESARVLAQRLVEEYPLRVAD